MMYGAGAMPLFAPAAMIASMETPVHTVSNFDHLVTQWMSRVIVSCGSAANSSQLHATGGVPRALRVKLHFASGVCGVGPAERTGKSRVSYCPGGSRAATPASGRRPRKPREIGDVMVMLRSQRVLARANRSRDWSRPPPRH